MKKLTSVVCALAIVPVTALLPACSREAPKTARAEAPPIEVRVAPVVRQRVDRRVVVSGTLFGQEEATISAKVGGRIAELLVDVEDEAPSGKKLAQIETTDFELALAERRNTMAASLAKVGLTTLPESDFDPSTLPTVARARAEAANAQTRLERAATLFQQQPPLISQQDYEDIRTQAEVASRSAQVEILNAQATVADARTQAAGVATAAQRLADTAVSAILPADGRPVNYRVAQRFVSLGELVTPGQPLLRLVATDIIKFRGQVPEKYMGRVARGQSAKLLLDSLSGQFAGAVTRVSPRIDERTRAFEVEIEIPNTQGSLKPGAFARAEIVVGAQEDATFVPRTAILTFAGVERVFSVKDGKAVEHLVNTGEPLGDLTELASPLDASEVVVSGINGLTQGRAVKIVGPPAPTTPAAPQALK